MTTSFCQLPFDILFYIASNLDLEDIGHLGQSCRQLKSLLDERTLCRWAVENLHPCTKEAELARSEQITYKQAFQAIYDRRRAFANAHPFSARVLGRGNAFLYRQNTICILEDRIVRVLDVFAQCDSIQIDLTSSVRENIESDATFLGDFEFSMLSFSHDILVVHATREDPQDSGYILAINVASHVEIDERVLKVFRPTSSSKLFVRHNAEYIYYGTHSGIGDDGHRKWEITGVSLRKDSPLPPRQRAIMLENFHGTDIGSTIAFEIYNGCFYAVSNQGTFEVEEIDYTSFYHWVSFPVERPSPDAIERHERLYRRQHKQGPIHDSWTDLTLQVDDRTGEVVIVESRREWAQASSRQSRTFYVTRLEPSDKDEAMLPEDDPFTALLDSSNNAHWKPTPDLYSWNQHPEFASDDPSPRSFILSRTKFRGYNYSCSSFLDLVEDDRCCKDPSKPPCLRLRIGSRRQHVPQPQPTNKGKQRINTMTPVFVDTTHYRHSPICMWPPPASRCPCSSRLHDILNPPLASAPQARTVTGVLDEGRLVYMVKSGRFYGPAGASTSGAVVLVDFNRAPHTLDSASAHTWPTSSVSAPASMGDSACVLDDDDDADAPAWEWSLAGQKRCRDKTCW